MGDGKTPKECSRRRFLKSGGALVAGGVIGGASTNAFSQSTPPAGAAPPLPWKWVQLDPMEAGTRAYHTYLNAGG